MSRCILTIFIICMINICHAQNIKVSYHADSTSLTSIFKTLENRYGIHFAYPVNDLPPHSISLEQDDVPFEEFLSDLLDPYYFSYEIVNEQYVLIKNSKTLLFKTIDQTTRAPLPFASAIVVNTESGSVGNQNALIKISLSNPKEQSLQFSYLGYETTQLQLDTLPYQDTLTVALSPKATELQEVVVYEYLNQGVVISPAMGSIRINPQDMDILPGLAEPDILLSSQMLPGITSGDESASGISFRGSGPGQVFYYWNDIPVYNPAHYFGNISSFIPSAIGSLDIYKNTIPVKYGGASSGLMRITSRTDTSLTAESNINLTHADIYVQSPLSQKLGNLLVAGRRSFNDLLITPTYSALSKKIFEGSTTSIYQDGITENSFDYNNQIIFSDINAVWSLDINPDNFLRISGLHANSALNFDTQSSDALGRSIQTNDVLNTGLSTYWKSRWNAQYISELTFSRSRYDLHYALQSIDNFNERTLTEARENRLESTRLQFNHQISVNDFNQISLGQQLQWYQAETGTLFSEIIAETEEVYDNTQNHQAFLLANYFNWKASPLKKWNVSAGLRHTYYNILDTHTFNPQVDIQLYATPAFTLKGFWGIYRQFMIAAPETNFTLSNAHEQIWTLSGTLGQSPIKNQQLVMGFVYDKKGWLIDMELYQKKLIGINASRLNRLLFSYARARETIRGADILLKKRFRNLRMWLSYGFQDSDTDIPELDISDMTSGYNLQHQLQLVSTYHLKAFQFSIGFTSRTGAPYTQADSFEPSDDYYAPVYGNFNAARLPAYQRLDLSSWYNFLRKTESQIKGECGISVLNVLNSKNVIHRTYYIDDNDDGEFSLYQNDSNLYGFTLNASLRLKF